MRGWSSIHPWLVCCLPHPTLCARPGLSPYLCAEMHVNAPQEPPALPLGRGGQGPRPRASLPPTPTPAQALRLAYSLALAAGEAELSQVPRCRLGGVGTPHVPQPCSYPDSPRPGHLPDTRRPSCSPRDKPLSTVGLGGTHLLPCVRGGCRPGIGPGPASRAAPRWLPMAPSPRPFQLSRVMVSAGRCRSRRPCPAVYFTRRPL